jgi:hypothetical protein
MHSPPLQSVSFRSHGKAVIKKNLKILKIIKELEVYPLTRFTICSRVSVRTRARRATLVIVSACGTVFAQVRIEIAW